MMQYQDPIEEIWRIRDELGAQEGWDVHQLFERPRREEKKFADRLVRVMPPCAGGFPCRPARGTWEA